MSFKSGFESRERDRKRESHSLTQQVAVSSIIVGFTDSGPSSVLNT